jgi:hypothetical protein
MTFAAAETAGLGQIEALMGITPGGGATQYLRERIGRSRALEDAPGLGKVVATVAAGHQGGLPARRHPGKWLRDTDVPVLRDGTAPLQAQGGIRRGRHRRRGRPGGGQQRKRRRNVGPAADSGNPDLGHRRGHPRRVPAVRHPAGPPAPRHAIGPGVGTHRQPAHRQCDPAGAELAAGRSLGEDPRDSQAVPVRRDHDVRPARVNGSTFAWSCSLFSARSAT